MSLVYYPHSALKQKAEIVTAFDDSLQKNIDIMMQTIKQHNAVGIGANMCGILQRIVIVPKDISDKENDFIIMINPEITEKSVDTQTFNEASLSLPGIEAMVTRPKTITVTYTDIEQQKHTLTATDFLSTVIQHEIDYLDGVTYLNHLPKGKAQLLRERMQKYIKKIQRHGEPTPPEAHTHYHNGKACNHKH